MELAARSTDGLISYLARHESSSGDIWLDISAKKPYEKDDKGKSYRANETKASQNTVQANSDNGGGGRRILIMSNC